MKITKMATWKRAELGPAIEISDGVRTIQVLHAQIIHQNADQIHAGLEAIVGEALPDLHVHVNRDDTIALAWGEMPDVWPEDMPQT